VPSPSTRRTADDHGPRPLAVEINGKPSRIEWMGFNPKKYAHHEE
jgi:hypothetical protein